MMEYVKVVIVGGGAAGLGAAKTLGSKVDFLLIEAQDYLGGRIRTVDVAPTTVVDLGAQFIHGKTKNLVYEICEQLDCILPDDNEDFMVLTSDRTKVDANVMNKAMASWEEILVEARAKFADRTIPTHYSFSEYLLEHFKERLLVSLPSSANLIDALLDYFNQTELIENGCSTLANLSLAEYGSFEYLEGNYEYEFRNGGYRPFIKHMKSFLPDDRVRLNCEVVRVKYLQDSHQVLLTIRHLDRTSKEDTSSILCDHVIWTSSLGHLKENFSSIFADEIELIKQKTDAIEKLGFDTVNKVILMYERKFWPENICEIMILHTEVQRAMELSESLKELLEKERIQSHVVRTIVQAIHRLDVLPSTDAPVLICWFGGEAAILLEDLNEQLLGQLIHEVLSFYLNVPPNLHQPIRTVKSEWYKNRFIRGSYSYYSIQSNGKDGEQLRMAYAPNGIPRIQFAGEATHEKFYSTVHGALESGIRAAEQLLTIQSKETESKM